MKGPEFLRCCEPLVSILRERSGQARSSEVTDAVIERLGISEAEQEVMLKDGVTPRVYNQVAWARLYLVKAGVLESNSPRGIWALTQVGTEIDLTPAKIQELFKKVQRETSTKKKSTTVESEADADVGEKVATDDASNETVDYKTELIELLRAIPPKAFERFCKRLLETSGFERVTVTGRTNDGGIDGHGILMLNPFVSYKAVFQCKRYKGSVGSAMIRDFRGAMLGRADKGIIITTGAFTTEAKKEAYREGVSPIELVDGDELVELCADHGFGLKPKRDFVVDKAFFQQFSNESSSP